MYSFRRWYLKWMSCRFSFTHLHCSQLKIGLFTGSFSQLSPGDKDITLKPIAWEPSQNTTNVACTSFSISKVYHFLISETEEQSRARFQIELEFVQCLANPNYLNCKFLHLWHSDGSLTMGYRFCNISIMKCRMCILEFTLLWLTYNTIQIGFSFQKFYEWCSDYVSIPVAPSFQGFSLGQCNILMELVCTNNLILIFNLKKTSPKAFFYFSYNVINFYLFQPISANYQTLQSKIIK